MSEHAERRRFTRIHFDCNAAISQGDKRYTVHLIDISLNGALVEPPQNYELSAEQPITMEITLSGDISIVMRASLAHSSDKMLGFHCESIDMESMAHLRRLIELNMEDPHASERVLDELIG